VPSPPEGNATLVKLLATAGNLYMGAKAIVDARPRNADDANCLASTIGKQWGMDELAFQASLRGYAGEPGDCN
jgi:hypothetical protein